MRYLVSLFCLLFVACGSGPLLEAGTYDVTVTYTRDDLARDPTDLRVTDAVWFVSEKEKEYNLKVAGAVTDVDGEEEDNKVVFLEQKTKNDYDCERVESYFLVELYPTDEGTEFDGEGTIRIDLGRVGPDVCDLKSFYIEADVSGKKR
jgi:hypothetical protein